MTDSPSKTQRRFLNAYWVALLAAAVLNILFFIVLFIAFHRKPSVHAVPHAAQPVAVTVRAQPQAKLSTQVVQRSFAGQAHIVKRFNGPAGLEGLVISLKSAPTDHFIAYFDAARQVLLLGQVLDKHGKNTTMQASQQYLSDPLKPVIYKAIRQWPAVVTGSKHPKHTAIIMIDPNAPLFSVLYKNFLVDERDSALQLRWVLVNYLKPMGPNLAGWILQAKDPARCLALVADKSPDAWANQVVPALNQVTVMQLRHNWNFMQSYHLIPGPVVAFRTTSQVYVMHGFVDPESFDNLLPSIMR